RFTAEALKKNAALVERLKGIAGPKGATPGQLALAWLLSRKPWIVPIPGTRKRSRLEENIGAVSLQLSETDLAAIEAAVESNKVEGQRYRDNELSMVNL
ncbi:MAG TPA: aldo/keto reductase, partial [Afipia sp.]